MATTVVLTGDKELNRRLRDMPGKIVGKLVKRAIRPAADMVLSAAREQIPVRQTNTTSKGRHPPGSWRDSLVVRTAKRSNKGLGFIVTQKSVARYPADSSIRGFYGAFQELGYHHVGRIRNAERNGGGNVVGFKAKFAIDMTTAKEQSYKYREITTYRKKKITIQQLRAAKKMKGRWLMRRAGLSQSNAARTLYAETLRSIVNEESHGG